MESNNILANILFSDLLFNTSLRNKSIQCKFNRDMKYAGCINMKWKMEYSIIWASKMAYTNLYTYNWMLLNFVRWVNIKWNKLILEINNIWLQEKLCITYQYKEEETNQKIWEKKTKKKVETVWVSFEKSPNTWEAGGANGQCKQKIVERQLDRKISRRFLRYPKDPRAQPPS